MDEFINYLKDNYTWVFSGIGVAIIGVFIKQKITSNNNTNQNNNTVNQTNINTSGDVVGRDKNTK